MVFCSKIAAVTAMTEKEKAEAGKEDCEAKVIKVTTDYVAERRAHVNALRRTTETNQLYQNR
jgi:hypothetical protein